MLLQETNRVTSVTGQTTNGEFTYNVNYNVEQGALRRLHCNVGQTVKVQTEVPGGEMQNIEQQVSLGYIILESGNKQIVLQENADIAAHLIVFNQIVDEVKGSLTPKTTKAAK